MFLGGHGFIKKLMPFLRSHSLLRHRQHFSNQSLTQSQSVKYFQQRQKRYHDHNHHHHQKSKTTIKTTTITTSNRSASLPIMHFSITSYYKRASSCPKLTNFNLCSRKKLNPYNKFNLPLFLRQCPTLNAKMQKMDMFVLLLFENYK